MPIKEVLTSYAEYVFNVYSFAVSDNGDICGFFGQGWDKSDKPIPFVQNVPGGDTLVPTFQKLERALQDKVKADIHAQIQQAWSPEDKPLGIAEALLVADEVIYCRMVEEAVLEGKLSAIKN